MGNSKIEWTEKTWNPVVGCSKISPGCAHCYAETMANRLKGMALKDIADGTDPGRKRHYIDAIDDKGRWTGKMIPVPESLDDPLRWKKPQMIFVNSMSDLFHEDLPFDFVDQVFATMYAATWHTFQILTKRPDRMLEYFQSDPIPRIGTRAFQQWTRYEPTKAADNLLTNADIVGDVAQMWPLLNVWLGTSCENRWAADQRTPFLIECPAAVRFLSCEPLLGPIVFADVTRRADVVSQLGKKALNGINWVICGGESGHNTRPMHPDWPRSLRDQCQAADVPFFFKQWGEWAPWTVDDRHGVFGDPSCAVNYKFEDGSFSLKIGKAAAGRLLDGREWNEMPVVECLEQSRFSSFQTSLDIFSIRKFES